MRSQRIEKAARETHAAGWASRALACIQNLTASLLAQFFVFLKNTSLYAKTALTALGLQQIYFFFHAKDFVIQARLYLNQMFAAACNDLKALFDVFFKNVDLFHIFENLGFKLGSFGFIADNLAFERRVSCGGNPGTFELQLRILSGGIKAFKL
ncbi:MAG: hypothetical protein CVV41_12780 [Candidatus Riflebacteria bacterium HGW-Riflebacteria-1]|nr:MAG: hypothetical protein CVV41_12780 [Candidatus Riflebacteria bacterium HGW-Riflebacteria-1]